MLAASPQPFRDIWRVFLGTGLRAGELSGLEWSDVHFEQAELHVRAETFKGQRQRTIPLRQDLLGILRRLRLEVPQRMHKAARECAERRLAQARRAVGTAERLVFCNGGGGPWGDNLSRRLDPCLAAAGLPQRIDVHTLRHTFGSHLVRAGVDVKTVQELMGHSSAMVTLDICVHGFGDRKAAAVEVIPLSGQGHVQVAAPNPRPKAMGM